MEDEYQISPPSLPISPITSFNHPTEYVEEYTSVMAKFISLLCSHEMLDEAAVHWTTFSEYFNILVHVSDLGWDERK